MFFKAIGNVSHVLKLNTHLSGKFLLKRYLTVTVVEDRYIVVHEHEYDNSEKSMKFPTIWLRDNCNCSECFHPTSQSRRIDWGKLDLNVKVDSVFGDSKGQQINVHWSDQHKSTYHMNWLKERVFNSKIKQNYLDTFYRPKTKHWRGSDFEKIASTFEFKNIINDDTALKSWLETLCIYGVAKIKNAPLEKTVVRQIAERVGFIRKTSYGEEFIVQAKPGAKNYAYLSDPLPLHTDLPYYEYKPSVNILHCMVQSNSRGGSNLLVDGFHIADRMKKEHPKDYNILTQTLVDWNDIGGEDGKRFHNIWRAPVICLNIDGNYTRINHSIPQRDSHFSVELEEVLPWYEAYMKFVRMACNEAYAFKTKPGDVLTFNNIRLLHGRTGYDDTEGNVRYIVGAYLDWDIIYSKLRVLKTA